MAEANAWPPPPETIHLASGEVHLWRASLDVPPPWHAGLCQTLSPDEHERAARFYFAKDRRHFEAGRGLLRVLLGRYLSLPPQALRFAYGAQGKPLLKEVEFNMSHSGGLVLYGVTQRWAIGVDVERHRPAVLRENIAESYFSPREVAALRSLQGAQQVAGFFNCWTRKEAYIKARGYGLSLPLDGFDVTLRPGEPARLLDDRTGADPSRWTLVDIPVAQGYAAALAVEAANFRLRQWRWEHVRLSGFL